MKRSYEVEPVRNTTDKRRFPSPSSTLYSPSRVAAESQVNGMSGYFGTVYLLFFFISIYLALFCLFSLPFISFSPPLDFSAFACHSFAHCPSLHVIHACSPYYAFVSLSLIHCYPRACPPNCFTFICTPRDLRT